MKNIDKITNYLLSDSEDVFILHQSNLKKKGRTKILGPKTDSSLDPLMKTGFADAARVNKIYKELLENLEINNLSNNELVEELGNNLDINKEENIESEGTNNFLQENSIIDANTKTMILKLRLYHKWSLNSIWAKFKITKEQLNRLFNELK